MEGKRRAFWLDERPCRDLLCSLSLYYTASTTKAQNAFLYFIEINGNSSTWSLPRCGPKISRRRFVAADPTGDIEPSGIWTVRWLVLDEHLGYYLYIEKREREPDRTAVCLDDQCACVPSALPPSHHTPTVSKLQPPECFIVCYFYIKHCVKSVPMRFPPLMRMSSC